MALNPAHTATFSYVDRSGESSSWSIPVDQNNYETGWGSLDLAAVLTAFNAICDGELKRASFTETQRISNVAYAAAGQREQKYLVTYEDTITLVPYKFELPCRTATIDPPVNTDEYDITAAPFAAFVTAIEAYGVSPDGNPINVTSIALMGKNT